MKNKINKKKKIREFGYVELFETSAVGLPAYADAHKTHSLVKSLKDAFPDLVSDGLNFKENNPMVDEDQSQDADKPSEEDAKEVEEEAKVEEKAEVEEEADDGHHGKRDQRHAPNRYS